MLFDISILILNVGVCVPTVEEYGKGIFRALLSELAHFVSESSDIGVECIAFDAICFTIEVEI